MQVEASNVPTAAAHSCHLLFTRLVTREGAAPFLSTVKLIRCYIKLSVKNSFSQLLSWEVSRLFLYLSGKLSIFRLKPCQLFFLAQNFGLVAFCNEC